MVRKYQPKTGVSVYNTGTRDPMAMRHYYELVNFQGKSRIKAFHEAFPYLKGDMKSPARLEQSEAYKTVIAYYEDVVKERLKQQVTEIQLKRLRGYSDLLDRGEDLVAEAQTFQEKIQANKNQRQNIGLGIIDNSSFNFESNNKVGDYSDVLEAVIVE